MKAIRFGAVLALVSLSAADKAQKKPKVTASMKSMKSDATGTDVTFTHIKVGDAEFHNVVCRFEATMKCARVVNGKKATCESSKITHANIRKMGFLAALMLPVVGANAVAECFGK